jgi:hypothetical protein
LFEEYTVGYMAEKRHRWVGNVEENEHDFVM